MPLQAMNGISEDQAVRYIETYFEIKADGRPRFTGSHFEKFSGGDADSPYRITPADLMAVAMLSVHVRGQAALGITETLASEVEALLRQIPVDAKMEGIEGVDFEMLLGSASPAQRLWDLLRQNAGNKWRVGPTTASKILARKRPHLIPIYDSVVRKETLGERSGNYWRDWFDAFHKNGGGELARNLREVREKSGQRHLSLIRVLDIVLWMNGTGSAKVAEIVDDGQ